MSETTTSAQTSDDLWNMARDAGLFGATQGTNAFDRSIDNFAAAVRASVAAPAQSAEAVAQDKCAQDVYKHGQSIGLFDIPKETANAICAGITAVTGARVDWHYIAGRVHMKALAASPAAPAQSGEPVISDELHPDTAALIRRFARALGNKLLSAQRKYGYSANWMREDWADECRTELMRHIEKGDPRDVAAYCAFLWHHNESTAAPRPAQTAESEAVAMDADELAELAQTAEDFEDNGETSTPYDVLMNWAARGLLDCTHFELTSAGKALIAAQPAGGGEQ